MSSRRETAFVEARRQSGAAECGMTALEMVLAYHGCKPERERLRRTLGYSPYGASAEMLLAAARDCGFDAGGFDVTIDQLDAVPVPAILHCRRGHFVVYEGKRRSLFCIVDPATGRRRVKRRDLQRLFSGIVVAIEPREAAPGSARQRDRTLSRGLLAAWTSERLPAVAAATIVRGSSLMPPRAYLPRISPAALNAHSRVLPQSSTHTSIASCQASMHLFVLHCHRWCS